MGSHPLNDPERDLIYDWIINKLFIRKSVVLKLKRKVKFKILE